MRSARRINRRAPAGAGISMTELFGLALAPMAKWARRQILKARLHSLHGLAEYFAWQEANGRAGLADTHKRIAETRSDLNCL